MDRLPRIAVIPEAPALEEAARAGGADLVEPTEADAIIWSTPSKAMELGRVLATSPARWIQLPFAGIEGFFAAGVIDPERTWTCAKGIYGPTTAEGALALMLAAARRIPEHAAADSWFADAREQDRHQTLAGSTTLIIGTGGIGRALAAMLEPLGSTVVAVNRSGTPMPGAARTHKVDALPEIVGEADWVVLACALTPETAGLVDGELLARFRPSARLVNVARGGLVVTDDLVTALRAGSLAGAGLDVTDPEPLPDGHPLWTMPEVIITPHVANTWRMATPQLASLIERNVRAFAAGEPLEGLVDPRAGY